MGAPPEVAGSTIRVSLGWSTTEAEIEHFLEAWTAMYQRTRTRAAPARAA
jgi:cysteine desulfurase